jgi:hypothetical protein
MGGLERGGGVAVGPADSGSQVWFGATAAEMALALTTSSGYSHRTPG